MDPALVRFVGWALIVGPVAFMVGAARWRPPLFEGELGAILGNVATRQKTWTWIHTWMGVGTVVTAGGFSAWLALQSRAPAIAAAIATTLFLLATAVWLVGGAVRIGVEGAIAPAAAADKAMPAGLPPWHSFIGSLHSSYMILANGAGVALGVSALFSDPRLTVAGWVGVALGAILIVGYLLFKPYFSMPFLPTVYPAVLGVALLVSLTG